MFRLARASSTSNVINFSLLNGTYTYSTGASGHTASQSTGQVTVNGANINARALIGTYGGMAVGGIIAIIGAIIALIG